MDFKWLLFTLCPCIVLALNNILDPIHTSNSNGINSIEPNVGPPSLVLGQGFMGGISNVLAYYKEMKTIKGKMVYSFLGLQYGLNPSGRARFKKVGMYKLASNTVDASNYGSRCPQMKNNEFDFESDENCLFLNVYTTVKPDEKIKGTIPVMVFSHGGDGTTGDSSLYKPDVLLDYNVILVTFQYRLGTLGSFTMNSKDTPGNVALWDQILALQWVQENIKYLGGDAGNVTVFGQGFGATLTSSLLLLRDNDQVPKSLFNGMILESGSFLKRGFFRNDQEGPGIKIVEENYCPTNTGTTLSCMKDKPAAELTMNLHAYMRREQEAGRSGYDVNQFIVQNGPTILKEDKLIKDYPENIIKDSKNLIDVPVMIGVNRHEGSYHLGGVYWSLLQGKYEDAQYLKNEFLLDVLTMSDLPGSNAHFAEALRNDYVGDVDMSVLQDSAPGLIDLMGDILVKIPAWRTAEVVASSNKSYFYTFDYESKDSLFDTYFPCQKPEPVFDHGVTHGDELMYLFNMPDDLEFDEAQNTTRDRLATLWTNFAIYHDPTPDVNSDSWSDLDIPKWEPIGVEKNYLLIEEDCSSDSDFMKRRHIARLPTPLPTQEEYDSVSEERTAFLATFIVFLLISVALGGVIAYMCLFKK